MKSNAIDHNGISVKRLLCALPVILRYVTHIINSCIGLDSFLASWNKSKPAEYKDLKPLSIIPTFRTLWLPNSFHTLATPICYPLLNISSLCILDLY